QRAILDEEIEHCVSPPLQDNNIVCTRMSLSEPVNISILGADRAGLYLCGTMALYKPRMRVLATAHKYL
ncbi:hypothetical protein, partial [Clostridium perfringens]